MTDKEDRTKDTKKDNRYAISIVFSIISFVASTIALAVALPRMQLGVDYLGIIVSILGTFATLLLAMQLYNVFKMKEDAKEVEQTKKSVSESYNKIKHIEKQYPKIQEKLESFDQRLDNLQEKIGELGEYVDDPEWIRITLDSEGKWLFGIRHDGSVDWQVGIPGPINKELEALKKRITELEKKETNAPDTSGASPEEPEA